MQSSFGSYSALLQEPTRVVVVFIFLVGNPTDFQSTPRVPTRGEKKKTTTIINKVRKKIEGLIKKHECVLLNSW